MSKKKSRTASARSPGKSPVAGSGGDKRNRVARTGPVESAKRTVASAGAMREVVESVAIAFMLAFLFRTFEAEAFVIPTGSMAPTLMGRHKDLTCEECGFPYQVSASAEVDSTNGHPNGTVVVSGVCPNCGHTMYVNPDSHGKTHRSYKGDRILVGKFPYRISDPQRWDVAVFRYPGGAKTNFIKRIVGLPGETIRISHGDLFVKHDGDDAWRIARKPLKKVRAMMQTVYDNDYLRDEIVAREWPARWGSPAGDDDTSDGWAASDDGRSFRTEGSASTEAWLRYRHLVHAPDDRPELITDFVSYNHGTLYPLLGRNNGSRYWVGDLALDCRMEVKSVSGEAIFQLVEGGRRFKCRIDLSNGLAGLSIDGLDGFHPAGQTGVDGPGEYHVFFANFDDQLLLTIDGRQVSFDAPATYDPLDNVRPTDADLQPAGIGSKGAALEVSHLKLYRDIYYIAERYNSGMTDHDHVDFRLEKDQFLALGDNSAESKDSRLWGAEGFEYYVSRELLIGKALAIYWPHSLDRIPGTPLPIRFFPNFWRMGLVR